ncbi:NADH-quinone oxidoreductase subunit NuoE [Plastorhodobacter daqingensis]|uniref:NADH-quinone oxidoreductase subunit NuoE n=1 Tax=Plastorhodobacter daqingensis TaxID=1387281 RepID=A0ABW2UHE3_9RHOB
MLRRLHPEQPASFAFTPANLEWAQAQISKYPEGRQASAIIPLLWRAQEQEGWLTRPAIEYVASMLGMAYIRALEVATFYFMFQLQPVGSVANIQICGTTTCMICGAEDLVGVCQELIAAKPHTLSADGKFSWEEVECLGACANAPMAQIGKDYYENLTAARLREIIAELAAGRVPVPGPQNGRYSSEPEGGPTTLVDHVEGRNSHNASVRLALDIGDTVKRIDGTEVPILTPWLQAERPSPAEGEATEPTPGAGVPADDTGVTVQEAPATTAARAERTEPAKAADRASGSGVKPVTLSSPRTDQREDLTRLEGVDADTQAALNELGIWHLDQIAAWTAEELAWVDANLKGHAGRASREGWVAAAQALLKADGN